MRINQGINKQMCYENVFRLLNITFSNLFSNKVLTHIQSKPRAEKYLRILMLALMKMNIFGIFWAKFILFGCVRPFSRQMIKVFPVGFSLLMTNFSIHLKFPSPTAPAISNAKHTRTFVKRINQTCMRLIIKFIFLIFLFDFRHRKRKLKNPIFM